VPVNIIIGGGEKLPAFDSLHYLDWQAFTDIWVNMPFIFRIIISVVFVDLYSV